MDQSLFPPLTSSLYVSGPTATPNWKTLLSSQSESPEDFNLSYIPNEEDKIVFLDEEIDEGSKLWNLALMGYTLGRRPFYGNLLLTINNL